MAEGSERPPPRDALVKASPSLVVLEVGGRTASGFVATPEGHLVTSLHAVAGARSINVVLPDGIRSEVVQVVALDERRDLAVLRLPLPDMVPALPLSSHPLPGEGDTVYVLRAVGGPAPEVRSLEVRAVQVLGDWLTLLELSRTLSEETSGGPVLDSHGGVVGVATTALANGRSLGLVVPCRYVAPLLRGTATSPLAALDAPRRRAGRVRQVPQHPLSLLEGASLGAVESIASMLGQAINVGAPAYNRGDVEGCYRLYAHTAEQLIDERADCPGAQRALRDGLLRCNTLADADDRAWALRDTFDGLLDVIQRWLRARPSRGAPAPGRKPPPKEYLN
jgi:S1-C subfamily serine protease